jgi:hypothetical protein
VDYGYTKIFNDYTEEGLAQTVVNEMETNLNYQDGDLYRYYNNTWIKNNNDEFFKNLFTQEVKKKNQYYIKFIISTKILKKEEFDNER